MGNTFGYMPNNGVSLYLHPEITPDPLKEPKSDPLEGFGARQERKINATIEELQSAKIPPANRDYCSDQLLEFQRCRKDVWPFVVKCEHQKHAYLNCQYEDYLLRMKEYERERRLMIRAQKKGGADGA